MGFMDEGTTFRNCRLPSGKVVGKCVCEAGQWVNAGTLVTPLPGLGPQCYRRSTKSFVSVGTSVPCIRPKGKTCTCGNNGKWSVSGGHSSRADGAVAMAAVVVESRWWTQNASQFATTV